MERLRHRLSTFIICSTLAATCAFAQSTLSQIQDTVYTPSGALFNGTAVITWTGASSPVGGAPAPYNTTVNIYSGALSVLLVPSTTANPPANYQVVYNSSDGSTTWTETWQVPPSSSPLRLSQVRVAAGTPPGGSSGSTITIPEITGLNDYLSSLSGSLATLTALVNSLDTSVATTNASIATLTNQVNAITSGSTTASFSDAETPGGAVNGSNTTFTLANTPGAAQALTLYRNGILQANGTDYTLSGQTVTFGSHSVPQTGDIVVAYYRMTGTGPQSSFADDVIPQGTINGNNLIFTLTTAPNPASSLKLFKNGALLQQNSDYTLNGSTITFVSTSVTPQNGDTLAAYYRTIMQP